MTRPTVLVVIEKQFIFVRALEQKEHADRHQLDLVAQEDQGQLMLFSGGEADADPPSRETRDRGIPGPDLAYLRSLHEWSDFRAQNNYIKHVAILSLTLTVLLLSSDEDAKSIFSCKM